MPRKKTPQQIEAQMNRLWDLADEAWNQRKRRGVDFDKNQQIARNRHKRIVDAGQNTRRQNGYTKTDARTRYLDNIYQRNTGGKFTIQGGKIVNYRGAKGGSTIKESMIAARGNIGG